MNVYRIRDFGALAALGATEVAQKIARDKAETLLFNITDIKTPAMHILKQEALSVGGDFLTPKGAILSEDSHYCGVLVATKSQLKRVIHKCKMQDFGLKNLALNLERHLSPPRFSRRIMGVVNVTPDSFYAASRVTKIDEILEKIERWIGLGVGIIDIGGASSRPNSENSGSETIGAEEELKRLESVLLALRDGGFTSRASFSIDSYNAATIELALKCGFRVINDVNSLCDEKIMRLARDFEASVVAMHNAWVLERKSSDIVLEVEGFFAAKIEALEALGVKNILLDVGFGFGKTSAENLALTRHLGHFLHFGREILFGASRKRSIGEIVGKDTDERLFGSLALHQVALENGANIIRCHDVEAHLDALKILEALGI